MSDFQPRVVLEYWPGKPRHIAPVPIQFKRRIDDALIAGIICFIRESARRLAELGLAKVVLGISGGVDSACAAALVRRALGKDAVLGVVVDLGLPGHSRVIPLALATAEALDIGVRVVHAPGILNAYAEPGIEEGPFSRINAVTRGIHNVVFQVADGIQAAVVCTTDRSEEDLGRHMEYFYGHFAPLAGFYKTEVIEIGRFLGVPETVLAQEPGCFDAWFDSEVLGAGYEIIDPILFLLVEREWTVERIGAEYGIDPEWIGRLARRVQTQPWRMRTRRYRPKAEQPLGGDRC